MTDSPNEVSSTSSTPITSTIYPTNTVTMVDMVKVQPYEMCSQSECIERVRTKEISIYEQTNKHSSCSSSNSSSSVTGYRDQHDDYDPCRMITVGNPTDVFSPTSVGFIPSIFFRFKLSPWETFMSWTLFLVVITVLLCKSVRHKNNSRRQNMTPNISSLMTQ
jgi:hypothetical protein